MRMLLTAAAVAILPAAALAEQTTYVCRIDTKRVAYLPEEMVIGLDDQTGTAVVADPLIMFVHEAPMQLPLSTATEKKLSLAWELPLTSRTGQTTIMKYSASLQFPSLRLTVYATPSGYSNRFRGQGRCQVTTQTLEDLK